MKYTCPKCGNEIKSTASVSPEYIILRCHGTKRTKVSRNKWVESSCDYKEFIKRKD